MRDRTHELRQLAQKRQNEIWSNLDDNFEKFKDITSFALKFVSVDHRTHFFLNHNMFKLEFDRLIGRGFSPESVANRFDELLKKMIMDCAKGLATKIKQCSTKFKHIKTPKIFLEADRVLLNHTHLLDAHKKLVAKFGARVEDNKYITIDSAGQLNLVELYKDFKNICHDAYNSFNNAQREMNIFIDDYLFKSMSGIRKLMDSARKGLGLAGGGSG